MRSSAIELRKAGLSLLASVGDDQALLVLEDLLLDSAEEIRVAAVSALNARLNRPAMAEVLTRYLSTETYFYNVAAWFDRLIYSVPPY